METTKIYFEDIAVGDESQELKVENITRTMIVKFAGASGDFNPIHHDEEFAKNAGLPSIFAMGMMNAGFISGLLQDWMGIENISNYKIQFRDRVWPGDSVTCKGQVVEKDAFSKMVKVDLLMVNQHEKPVIKSSACVKLPSRSSI